MAYAISPSWLRLVLAAILVVSGAIAWFWVSYARWGWLAGSAAVLCFLMVCTLQWRRECARLPSAIRLIGGQRAIFYFPPCRTKPPRGLADVLSAWRSALVRPRRFDERIGGQASSRAGHDGIEADIVRVVLWPGRLIGLTLRPVAPVASLQYRWRRLSGGTDRGDHGPHCPATVLLFADSMPAPCFRALGIQLRCLQRGVTFVEHR